MNGSTAPDDPATRAILDFQSVMTQWLETQAAMVDLFARRQLGSSPVPEPSVPLVGARPSAGEPRATQDRAVAVATSRLAAASRYTLSTRSCFRPSSRASLAPGHVVVLTDDGRGVATEVADRLRRTGLRVAIVSISEGPDARPDVFQSPLDSIAEAERIAGAIGDSCGPIAALVHLIPLASAAPFERLDDASWWRLLTHETRALFFLVRAIGTSLQGAARHGGAACLAATCMGGTFGVGQGGCSRPSQGGVTGFLKCVAIEYPEVRVRTVDLPDGAAIETLADHVLDELWTADTHTEIGYANGERVALDLQAAPASMDSTFDLPSDAVILATGGARGITAEVCLELGERYQPTFVLVGQSPLPPLREAADTVGLESADLKRALTQRLQAGGSRVTPAIVEKAYKALLKERETRETISRLSETGARTHYVRLDVQDEQAFGALIEEIYGAYGRIDGVLHGAGVIEDKLVRDKSLDSFDRVVRTKVSSAFTLSRHLRPDSLRFLAFFASVAGRFGNRGQADYAAANEVVSKLATTMQRTWPGRVCAIAWAPWDKAGMVSQELKEAFARRGVGLLSPRAGRHALWLEIQQRAQSPAEVVIGGSGSPSLAAAPPEEACPLLKRSTRTASSEAVRFETRLEPSIDRYLDDHRLDGQPVLPLAFATEMMAEAAQIAWPDRRVVGVRDLQMFKGIVVDAPAVPLVISVGLSRPSSDGALTEVEVEIGTPATTPALRYRAIVELAAGAMTAPTFEVPSWDLRPLPRPLAQVYDEWAFHGPLFRRLIGIEGIGVHGIVGTVYSSSTSAGLLNVGRSAWIIDPFVFDALLQMFLFWSRHDNDTTALPSRFRSFRCYAPLSDQRLTCYVAAQGFAGGHGVKGTVYLLDAVGRVRAVLDGMEASRSRALNRLVSTGVEP